MARELTFPGIRGEFYLALAERSARSWVPQLANLTTSDSAKEDYVFAGAAPGPKANRGGRKVITPRTDKLTIYNEVWDHGVDWPIDDWRRDKTDQIMLRVADLGGKAATLPQRRLSEFLLSSITGGSGPNCFDGLKLYDDRSGSTIAGVNNDVTENVTTPAEPTEAEMAAAIYTGVEALREMVDDQGDPINEDMTDVMIMCPWHLRGAVRGAISNEFVAAGQSNSLRQDDMNFTVNANLRLGTKADGPHAIYLFRTDAPMKAFIWQTEVAPRVMEFGPTSEYAMNNRHIRFVGEQLADCMPHRPEVTARVLLT